jgi:N-acetyl-anhydromuramoyl-L-alanine amidase
MNSGQLSGWIPEYKHLPSPNFDCRPAGVVPDLLVIHCISLPEGCYGNGNIEALFTGTLDCKADPSFESLRGLRVSAHFVIARDGQVTQFVDLNNRAWHAGVSSFQGRASCNDFSIGVELEGCISEPYTPGQIEALALLSLRLVKKFPSLVWVAGHSDIAPQRKTDPGPHFSWADFLSACHLHGVSLSRPVFG